MTAPTILVGVAAWQPDSVALTAIDLAARLGASILFVTVDMSRQLVDTEPDGSILAESFDSDSGDVIIEHFDARLEKHLHELAARRDVPCRFLASAGNPADVLGHAANDVDALMIVVGTRKAKLSATVREFFSGSVAVSLAHRQHRAVLVVPVEPVTGDTHLPWDGPDA